jgi:hypothetical protein
MMNAERLLRLFAAAGLSTGLALAAATASLPAWGHEAHGGSGQQSGGGRHFAGGGSQRGAAQHRGAVATARAGNFHAFRGRDVRAFNEHDRAVWRSGRWHQGWYGGRFGWWWFVGGAWYLYDAPFYPYPLTVSEVVFSDPAMAAPAPQPVIQPGAAWYYCDNPPGYYPYVTVCNSPFRPVNPGP